MSDYRRGLAFKAGEKAARASKSRETCDRQRGTIYFDDWQDGYENASHHAGETND